MRWSAAGESLDFVWIGIDQPVTGDEKCRDGLVTVRDFPDGGGCVRIRPDVHLRELEASPA